LIIRFVGFGGQGIVLSSYIIGQAAIYDGKQAIQNQSYGSESRGGECRADVIISEDEIDDLETSEQDVLVAMTQPGYEKFINSLKPGGTLILDADLVVADDGRHPPGITTYHIAATDIALQKFERKIVANMIVLGFMNALLNLVTTESLKKGISGSVPKGTEELNLKAMSEGIAFASHTG
jgi:2-oxoglutarate ferredoxin oxidoreductase subunit gamma